MKHKGLVIVYDPHALMQFLQFYCMNDYEAEWDALCLPKEDGEEEMHPYCERVGVFSNVYVGQSEYMHLSVRDKLKLFIPMVLFSVTGQRKKYCQRTLNQYVSDINGYDIVAANTENGFISGMLASFGKEKTVIYFEDGMGDYLFRRRRWKSIYRAISFENFQCVIMARLGYCGKGYTYLKFTKDTIKYCSVMEELAYRNYKEIRQFSMKENVTEKFKELLNRMYPELKTLDINSETAVAFTEPVEIDCRDWEDYVNKFVEKISQKYTSIVLKCHPREDVDKYFFPENITVKIIPKDIPAELLLPYFNKNDCYFMIPNSILVNVRLYDIKINILFSEYICKQMKCLPFGDYSSVETFCKRFVNNKYSIISI